MAELTAAVVAANAAQAAAETAQGLAETAQAAAEAAQALAEAAQAAAEAAAASIPAKASQAEAEAGVVDDKYMTPLKTAQAIAALSPPHILFGSWVDKTSSYGAQQAATDGFVVASGVSISSNGIYGYTDSNSNPTTLRNQSTIAAASNFYGSFTMPVKKSDYWKVLVDPGVTSLAVYWIPLGS
jgi:hypothetical protein